MAPENWNIKCLLRHRGNLLRTLLLVSRKDSFVRHCPPSLVSPFGYFLSLIYESHCPAPSMLGRDLLVDKKRREFWSRIFIMLNGRNTAQCLRKYVGQLKVSDTTGASIKFSRSVDLRWLLMSGATFISDDLVFKPLIFSLRLFHLFQILFTFWYFEDSVENCFIISVNLRGGEWNISTFNRPKTYRI